MPESKPVRVLAVATEWDSGHGGLSTLNRELCTAMASVGAKVVCLAMQAAEDERQRADAAGVVLVTPPIAPGLSNNARLARKPKLPQDFEPDLIIGHARVTGSAACALAEDHFPEAQRLHFIHMAPDEIEWLKTDREEDAGSRAEERTAAEIGLAKNASRVVTIGPRLHERFLGELHPYECQPLRLDPGFDAADGHREPPPGTPWRILLLGRAEDYGLKGLDIAAAAIGRVVQRWDSLPDLELVVRGTPTGAAEALRGRLLKDAGETRLSIVPRPYTTEAERLEADLRRASLVLMPSRSEGFGLVGLEAIVAGTPVLVSNKSGLGSLLCEMWNREQSGRFVVPVVDHLEQDAERWAEAIGAILRDREAAFRRAGELRDGMSQQKTWSGAAAGLLAALGFLDLERA